MKTLFYLSFALFIISCRSAEINSGSKVQDTSVHKAVPTWTGSMKNLHGLLTTIEPLIFDSKQFVLEKNQSLLKFTIQGLAEESKNISHSPTLISRDPTVRYVAGQFAEDLHMTATNQLEYLISTREL